MQPSPSENRSHDNTPESLSRKRIKQQSSEQDILTARAGTDLFILSASFIGNIAVYYTEVGGNAFR